MDCHRNRYFARKKQLEKPVELVRINKKASNQLAFL